MQVYQANWKEMIRRKMVNVGGYRCRYCASEPLVSIEAIQPNSRGNTYIAEVHARCHGKDELLIVPLPRRPMDNEHLLNMASKMASRWPWFHPSNGHGVR